MTDQSKPTTIFITQGKITVSGISETFAWEARTLSQVLSKISQTLARPNVSIVLGDNLYFLAPVFIDLEEKDTKTAILDQAKKILGQPLDKLGLDWYQVHHTSTKLVFQLFAVQKPLLTLIGRAAQSASLTVDSIQPLAFSIANQLESLTSPAITIFTNNYTTISLINQGKTLASTAVKPSDVSKHIQSMLSFSQQKYSLNPQSLIISDTADTMTKDQAKKSGLQIKQWDIDPTSESTPKKIFSDQEETPVSSTEIFEKSAPSSKESTDDKPGQTEPAKKDDQLLPEDPAPDQPAAQDSPDTSTDTDAADLDISSKAPKLPLSVTSNQTDQMAETTLPSDNNSSKTKLIIIITTVVVVLLGVVLGGIFVYRQAIESNTPPEESDTASVTIAQPTPEPSPSPTPEPAEEINKSEISINILNGSGVPGAAGAVADILEAAEFEDIDTGNADSYDFEETTIATAADNQALFDLITSVLEDDYTISDEPEELDEGSPYDAVITVGQL